MTNAADEFNAKSATPVRAMTANIADAMVKGMGQLGYFSEYLRGLRDAIGSDTVFLVEHFDGSRELATLEGWSFSNPAPHHYWPAV